MKGILAVTAVLCAAIGTFALTRGVAMGQRMVDAGDASPEAMDALWRMWMMAGACLMGMLCCLAIIIYVTIFEE